MGHREQPLGQELDGFIGRALGRFRHQPGAERRRVVITGMGALTPLGSTVKEFWEGLVAGRSGIARMALIDPTGYSCTYAGEVKDFDPRQYMDAKEARRMARFSQLAVAATRMALEDAGLDLSREDPDRVGVLLGNGNGGFPNIEEEARTLFTKGGMKVDPFFMPKQLPNMAAGMVSLVFGLQGYISTIVTACAAAAQALGEAAEVIRRGKADVMVSGGTEAGISELGLAGFSAMRALSTKWGEEPQRASRPFDAQRDGFIPAEGAGIIILESLEHARNRGALILAELVGFGVSSDAYHMVAPDAEGRGAARAMRWALEDAGLSPQAVDYVNAHGTSTPLNDATETLAIKTAFGDHAFRLAVSSAKSMIGHLLGAAGAVEAIATIKTLVEGVIHPTINYEEPDPQCDLDYVPNLARCQEVRVAISNSFGFGGQNACLVFARYPA